MSPLSVVLIVLGAGLLAIALHRERVDEHRAHACNWMSLGCLLLAAARRDDSAQPASFIFAVGGLASLAYGVCAYVAHTRLPVVVSGRTVASEHTRGVTPTRRAGPTMGLTQRPTECVE